MARAEATPGSVLRLPAGPDFLDTPGKAPDKAIVFDVIVIGLGAMGLAAAFEIAATGAKVLGLEQFQPGHDRGSSHGQTRMIRKAYLEGDFYVPLLERAYARWSELAALTGHEIFNTCGVLYSAPEDDPIVADTLKSGRRYGIPVETLSKAQAAKRFPLLRRPESHLCLFEPSGGYACPDATLTLYRRLARKKGAELRFEAPVTAIALTDGKVTVKTTSDVFSAHRLVVTAGPWLGILGTGLGWAPPLTIRRMVLHWFKAEGKREALSPAAFPATAFRTRTGAFLYGFPWTDAEPGLKFAFHDRQNPVTDPVKPNREVSPAEIAEITAALGEVLTVPASHFAAKTCLYSMTPDEHFLVGLLPGDERVAVAGGFSGHGFKFTPVVGEILRDLALDGATRFDISRFGLNRFEARAG
jgi:sarcosine oxidase